MLVTSLKTEQSVTSCCAHSLRRWCALWSRCVCDTISHGCLCNDELLSMTDAAPRHISSRQLPYRTTRTFDVSWECCQQCHNYSVICGAHTSHGHCKSSLTLFACDVSTLYNSIFGVTMPSACKPVMTMNDGSFTSGGD